MICYICYTEFHPNTFKAFKSELQFCYWCRDFTCFHHEVDNGRQQKRQQRTQMEFKDVKTEA